MIDAKRRDARIAYWVSHTSLQMSCRQPIIGRLGTSEDPTGWNGSSLAIVEGVWLRETALL